MLGLRVSGVSLPHTHSLMLKGGRRLDIRIITGDNVGIIRLAGCFLGHC